MKTVFLKRKKKKKNGLAAQFLYFCFTRVLVSPTAWAGKGLRNNREKTPQSTALLNPWVLALGVQGSRTGFIEWLGLEGTLLVIQLPTPCHRQGHLSRADCSKPHPAFHFPSLHQACVASFELSATQVSEKARGAQGGRAPEGFSI